jgi:hypothetical protein
MYLKKNNFKLREAPPRRRELQKHPFLTSPGKRFFQQAAGGRGAGKKDKKFFSV